MDKVLKQRLVGATILIALAVIFVPMLFEEPENVDRARDLSMDIPSPPPGRGEIRRLPLDPERMAQAQPEVLAEPPSSAAPEDIDVRPETRNQATPPESAAAVSPDLDPDAVAPTEAEPTEMEPQEQEPDEIVLVEEPLPADVDDESVADASPDPAPAPSPSQSEAAPQGDWMVQVASFSSLETADRIKAQLEQLGHRAESELLVRGDTRLHRVSTGPYLDRSQADRARSQIASTVRDVEPIVKALARGNGSAESAATGPVFSVQVGVFAEQANAERQSKQLLDQDFDAFIYRDETGSRPVWRVRVGRYAGRDQAEVLLNRLNTEASLEGLIVTHP